MCSIKKTDSDEFDATGQRFELKVEEISDAVMKVLDGDGNMKFLEIEDSVKNKFLTPEVGDVLTLKSPRCSLTINIIISSTFFNRLQQIRESLKIKN